MTPEQIAKAREIIAAATPGPWETKVYDTGAWGVVETNELEQFRYDLTEPPNKDDAKFISAARTLLPEALDEIERLQKELAEWRTLEPHLKALLK